MRNIRIASMLCMAVFAAAAHAGPGDWTGQGPFGGNVVSVKADPLVPTRVYAATTNGFFRSDDAGASWASAETGLLTPHPTNGVFAVSGTAAGTLYLFDDTGRLYASADGGNSWTPTGFTLGYDLVQYQSGIAVAAGGGGTVWVAANSAGLLVSNNSGATFAPALGFPNAAGNAATNVSIKPGDPQRIIVGGAGALCNAASGACPIYVSSNGGGTWTPTANPDGQTHVGIQRQPLSISWGPGGNVYAYYNDPLAGSGKLLHSTTNGDAWAVGIDAGSISGAIAASPADANTIYAASFSGPLVSTNGGVTFAPLAASGLTTNGIYRPAVQSLAAASDFATSHRLWAGTVAAGMYLSNDSGATFSATSDGMTATSIRALAVHPLDNTRVYAGFGDSLTDPSQAFFRSLASGTWTASNTGLRAYQLRSIYIDPTTTGTVGSTVIYAAGSGFDSAPHVTNDRNSGVYKSVDGGLTWTTQNGGFPVSGAGHFAGNRRTIIADPRSCDARGPTAALCTTGPLQTLFVTGGGLPGPANTHPYRVMKSLDAGATWADSSAGLPNDVVGPDCTFDGVGGVTPIVMDPTNSSVLYIGAFSGEATDALCNVVTPHAATGVYKSTDGGANWVLMSNGLPTYDNTTTSVLETLSLAIDPAHPQTLWVSTKNLSTDVGAPGEIYKTVDGGAHWVRSNAGINGPDVRALLVDPSNPGTIYSASGGTGPANPGGVYKSTDGGANWISISAGFPATAATALALDPIDPSVLYAGTNGGVFSMVQLPDEDGDGVPDLIENSGPNGGDANHDLAQDSAQNNVGTTAPGLFGTYGWQAGVANAQTTKARLRSALQAMNGGVASGGIQGGYFTVQVDNAACPQAVDVTADLAGPLGVDSVPHHGTYTYPRGLVHFEIPGCASSDVEVIFNAQTFGPGWTWRYYGPSTPGDNATMGWHDATSLVTSLVANDWKIHLANGAFGSYRPATVGSILFKGGPAYNEEIFEDKFDP